MDSRTGNIFHQPRSGSGNAYEQNVTKHLLTVLEQTNDHATERLWEQLIGNEPPTELGQFTYEIEVSPSEDETNKDRYLVGISRWGQAFEAADPSDKDARADGRISIVNPDTGEQISQLILEIKTGDDALSMEQLNRYQDQFDIPENQCYTSQWTDIFGILDTADLSGDIDAFLIDQYLRYLQFEQLQGTVAQITDIREGEEQSHLQKEVRIRRSGPDSGSEYSIQFWGTYYDPDNESPDETQTYSTRWMSEATFADLLSEIDRPVREEVFVDMVDPDDPEYPAFNRLNDWANNGGFGPQKGSYEGNESKVFAETKDEEGGYPEMRFVDNSKVRFGRITANGGANRTPLDLVEWEFENLIGDIQNEAVRRAVFVEGNLEPLWRYYLEDYS